MNKNNFRRIGLLMAFIMLGSCARSIVVPPGLSSKIIDIKINDTDNATIITIKTNNLPQYASFKVKSPPSISVDLASTDASSVSKSMSVNNGFVKKIFVKQLGESTGYSSRITVTLDKPLSYTSSADGNNIVLNISKTEEQKGSALQGLQLTTVAPLQGGIVLSPSTIPEALTPMGMETSPTTALEVAPLAGIGTSPSIAPEALTPMGMETSPTTALEVAPLAGIGTSPSIAPEALAPMGMETSPTTALEQPKVSTVPEQAITEENMQTNVINVAPPVPVEKKHKAKEKIAMVTPVIPITPAIQRIKIIHDIIVTPVPLIFKNNEAVLSKNAEEGLRRVADYMIEHRQLKLLILGYSDAYGPESYNKELSYYRTLWVKMALERYGVSSDRLMIKPMGKTNKFGHTKTTEARNRRVVLSIAK